MAERMSDAAYADDWDGWLYEGRNPNSRVHPEGVGGFEWTQPSAPESSGTNQVTKTGNGLDYPTAS
jgi:hypothetical protein